MSRHRENAAGRLLVIAALGFFALGAQTLLFRRFLSVYEGNELGIGAFFCSWLLWVAVGALVARWPCRLFDVLTRGFHWLPLLYIPAFLVQNQLILHSRGLGGIAPYELFPYTQMFGLSLLVNAPVSFLTGLFFTLACRWAGEQTGTSISRVYIFETLGSVAGGVLITLLLAVRARAETVFLAICFLLTMAVAVYIARTFFRKTVRDRLHLLAAIVPVLAVMLAVGLHLDRRWAARTDRHIWRQLLPEESYEGRFATPSARYLYGTYHDQFNIIAWETVVETLPDREHASSVAALTLAQHPEAHDILLIGSGAYSIGKRYLDLPTIDSVTWLHPDPAYPANLLALLPPDQRVQNDALQIPAQDARAYLREEPARYDLAVVHLPDATTLLLNRYYTAEFFELLKTRLEDDGVVAVRATGGANFIGPELARLGASHLVTLREVFDHIVIKPGDETWFIASDRPDLTENPDLLRDRFAAIPGAENVFPADALYALYLEDRSAFQRAAYEEVIATTPGKRLLNVDAHPKALLHSLLFAARQAGGQLSPLTVIDFFLEHGLAVVLLITAVTAVLRTVYLVRGRPRNAAREARLEQAPLDAFLLIFTTGMTGLALSVVLMFLFQARHGSIFLHIGLISALFMFGLFIGSLWSTRQFRRIKLWILPAGIGLHILFILLIAHTPQTAGRPLFALLFLAAGLLGGVYVPAAAHALARHRIAAQKAGGGIELADHLGGSAGALLTGLVFLPILGTMRTALALALLLLVNVPMLFVRQTKGITMNKVHWTRRIGRPLAYISVGLLLIAGGVYALAAESDTAKTGPVYEAGTAMLPAADFEAETSPAGLTYFTFSTQDGEHGYLFGTERLVSGVKGFAGPIHLAVVVDATGNLLDCRVIESQDTPEYTRGIPGWLESLHGRNLFESESLADVDGLTGATYTSDAILETLREAGAAFTQTIQGTPQTSAEPSPTVTVPPTDDPAPRGRSRNVDMPKLKRMIEGGTLSTHEAEHYRQIPDS